MSKVKNLVMITGVALIIAVAALMLLTTPPSASAQNPTPAPKPPVAKLELGGASLNNVVVSTTVQLVSSGIDPNVPVTRTVWTLTAPPGSQAKIKEPNAAKTEFTPDMAGTYKVDVVVQNAAGASPMASIKVHAGTIVGDNQKNCQTCHPAQTTGWATTVHAKASTSIQCEACHGPASQHLKGEKVMAVSHGDGACDVCHNTPNRITGAELKNAKHYTGTTFEEITGPSRQACSRCHSGTGYVSFIANPTNMAAWENQVSHVGCAVCHDPHNAKNFAQLRSVGKPIEVPFEAKEVGLSATCYNCHNGRIKPADAVKSSFPHYSSIGEMISDVSGVTYGATVPNSPHGLLIGNAPQPDPADKSKTIFGGQKPGACVVCHMWPVISNASDPNYKVRMELGAHSFNTKTPDGKVEYTASCVGCHAGMTSFNLKAKADYDGNGKTEGVQEEIKGLLDATWKAIEVKGAKQQAGNPYWVPPRDAQGNVDDKLDNAWFNFRTVYGVMWHADANGKIVAGNEGKAQAIHNFKRSCALLQLSLKDLGVLPAGAADCTK